MHLYHFGVFDWKNAGDTVIGQATEDLLGGDYWERYPLYYKFSIEGLVDYINNGIDAVVIGGGGLLIPGDYPHSQRRSGWYCPLTIEQVRQIKKPIIVFGIGYSRYWGQRDFNELFKPHINQMVRQSVFFSLRNSGSMMKLAKWYIEPELYGRLKYQPDPATLLSYIYPEYQNRELRENEIAFQPALDAPKYRFGNRQDEILKSIARAMKEFNTKIRLVSHIRRGNLDSTMAKWLDEAKVDYDIVELYGKSPKESMDFYAGCPLAIAMRGHGVMIPSGMGNPFILLISHDKIRFFLDDVKVTKGIYVNAPNLTENIVNAVNRIDRDAFSERIDKVKKQLWDITQNNLKQIRTGIKR